MKALVLALSMLVSASSFAGANLAEWSCNSAFGQRGPIKGYTLNLTKEADGKSTGVLFPVCLTCMVKPTIIHFDKVETNGYYLVYNEGQNAQLSILLNSLIPTRSHPASLTLKDFNKSKPVSFTCVSAN